MKIRTCPDFKFLFEKKKIRTCPDFYLSIEYFKSGLVQIWNFWLKISNPDLSRFELRTCPNFFFSIENLKSGLVQISIMDFRFLRGFCQSPVQCFDKCFFKWKNNYFCPFPPKVDFSHVYFQPFHLWIWLLPSSASTSTST